MVVYNKKVSKRRRKRTGSKRKITKPRNKRMNRSRQMGGAQDQAGDGDPPQPVAAAPQAPGQPRPRNPLRDLNDTERRFLTRVDQEAEAARVDGFEQPDQLQQGRPVNKELATDRAQLTRRNVAVGVENQRALCSSIKGAISNLIKRVKDCNTVNDLDLTELAQVLDDILTNVENLDGQCNDLGNLLQMLEQRLLDAGCLDADDGDGTFDARVSRIDPRSREGSAGGLQRQGSAQLPAEQEPEPQPQPVALE